MGFLRILLLLWCLPAWGQVAPDQAAALLGLTGPVQITQGAIGWQVHQGGAVMGVVGSSWEIAGTLGYSGQPLDLLVAVTPEARIAGAVVVRQSEPVLSLGLTEAEIAAYVAEFRGRDLRLDAPMPQPLARATVSAGVIADGILTTARSLAMGQGWLQGAGIDRQAYRALDWQGVLATGALAEVRVTLDQAALALAGAKVPVQPGQGDFLQLWAGVIDSPTLGRNLLGPQAYSRAMGQASGPLLLVMSRGVQGHRGTEWRASGVFDRLAVLQGETIWHPTADRFQPVKALALTAPEMREISLFSLPADIDPLAPMTLRLTARRDPVALPIDLAVTLPEAFRLDQSPLWVRAWETKRPAILVVGVMLAALTLILFAQEAITARPRLWLRLRAGFLLASFLILGVVLNGQLSVVQVVAFAQALLTGFRWETFLIEPVIFTLWGFVALGMLFWGRGVWCGWLCPFGALQELTNLAAQRLGVRQIAVPQALHERLWVIKYTAFVAILALSFHSMQQALILAEIEPFKTVFTLRLMRAWPFLALVLALLTAGLFIERFYCRYLCPLGAGLALPAKLKVFDWLKRRPQCGRECRLCETKCTVGAIDAIGRINANECVLCLRCQVTMNDANQCPVLKRRARSAP